MKSIGQSYFGPRYTNNFFLDNKTIRYDWMSQCDPLSLSRRMAFSELGCCSGLTCVASEDPICNKAPVFGKWRDWHAMESKLTCVTSRLPGCNMPGWCKYCLLSQRRAERLAGDKQCEAKQMAKVFIPAVLPASLCRTSIAYGYTLHYGLPQYECTALLHMSYRAQKWLALPRCRLLSAQDQWS